MAETEQVLLIPFKGGLDTFSNPQLLAPGHMTAAVNAMLDRPGCAYPGPGFTSVQWATTAMNANMVNHGIGALNHGAVASADQLVLWSTDSTNGTGPKVYGPGTSAITPLGQALAPWRQSTQRFQSDSSYAPPGLNPAAMTGPPQCAVSGNFAFYAWLTTGGGIAMAYQQLATRAWSGPYYLNTTGDWSTSTATALGTWDKMCVAGDGTYFRVFASLAGSYQILTYPVATPLVHSNITVLAGTFTNMDSASTADTGAGTGQGAFSALKESTHQLVGIPFSSAAAAPGSVVVLLSSTPVATTRPITSAPIRGASNTGATGFVFATLDGNENLVTASTSLTLTSIVSTTFTGNAYATARALTITNNIAGAATFLVAVEYYPGAQTVLTQTFAWNHVDILLLTVASPGAVVTPVTIEGWGGMAIMGKFYLWTAGSQLKPLLVLRSGWWHKDGAWGTGAAAGAGSFANPTAYLYDSSGTLYGKFGDEDIGSDALWPAFSAGGYVGSSLQPVPSGFRNTTSTQETLSYGFPQYGYLDFFSTRAADLGTPIGTRSALATVTWLQPTTPEPAAQMLQFGTSLIIPGTLTAYFDGANVFEAGFLHRAPTPVLLAVDAVATAAGLTPNAVYYYQVVAVYQDASGRIHNSAPSSRVAVTTTNGANKATVQIAIPTVNQTLRTSAASPVGFYIYRSIHDPGTAVGTTMKMYRVVPVAGVSGTIANTPGVDFNAVTFIDTIPDTTLTQYDQIYTAGFVGAAVAGTFSPPPFDSIAIWNNQAWGLANRNGPELWCSWPLDHSQLAPEGCVWSEANVIPLPAEMGQPKALLGMDNGLVIFGTRTDYVVSGTAPTRDVTVLDDPALFTAPILIPSSGGIRVLNGATRTPKGILVQTTQGFAMLGHDLQYTAVGIPVKTFTRANLYLPGVLMPEQRAVLLFSGLQNTNNLVYFYDTGEWSQSDDTIPGVIASTRSVAGSASQMYAISFAGGLYYTVDTFSEYMQYTTPWIELSNNSPYQPRTAGGYGYLREVHVLGTLPGGFAYQTAQVLTLVTDYDYAGNTNQPSDTQILTLSHGTQVDLDYQWRFGFSQGNARRVRFTVTIDGGAHVSGGSVLPPVLLTGLMLSYAVDAGLSRLGSGNSAGT